MQDQTGSDQDGRSVEETRSVLDWYLFDQVDLFGLHRNEEILALINRNSIQFQITGQELVRSCRRQIKTAVLSFRHLCIFPTELFRYNQVGWIDLSHNHISDIPEQISVFTRLQKLNLANNRLVQLPNSIGELRKLVWLDLTHNSLICLPETIGQLENLAGLGLSGCALSSLPISIGSLCNLTKLGLYNNCLTSVPEEIGCCVNLTKLDLSNNSLKTLPRELGRCKNLVWLNLSCNLLEELPHEIGDLLLLEELGLGQNRLSSVPNLSHLKRLFILPIYNNRLQTLGEWIEDVKGLEKLDLSGNLLEHISPGVFGLPKLGYLNLSRNRLRELVIPTETLTFTSAAVGPELLVDSPHLAPLTTLDLSENRLSCLPVELGNIKTLKHAKIGTNPWSEKTEPTSPGSVSLKEMLLNAVLNRLVPIASPRLRHLLEGVVAKQCCACGKLYHGLDHYSVVYSRLYDQEHVPVKRKHCSFACSLDFCNVKPRQ